MIWTQWKTLFFLYLYIYIICFEVIVKFVCQTKWVWLVWFPRGRSWDLLWFHWVSKCLLCLRTTMQMTLRSLSHSRWSWACRLTQSVYWTNQCLDAKQVSTAKFGQNWNYFLQPQRQTGVISHLKSLNWKILYSSDV